MFPAVAITVLASAVAALLAGWADVRWGSPDAAPARPPPLLTIG